MSLFEDRISESRAEVEDSIAKADSELTKSIYHAKVGFDLHPFECVSLCWHGTDEPSPHLKSIFYSFLRKVESFLEKVNEF